MIKPRSLLVRLRYCLEYENKPGIPVQIGHQLDALV